MKPFTLWIAGAEWTLSLSSNAFDSETEGITHYPRREIVVSQDGHPDAVKQTAVHEVLHAMRFTNGGNHPPDEEDCVRGLERPLLTLWTDERNRRFCRWLERDT